MKALITTISLIFATIVLTGCAGSNPYERQQYQQVQRQQTATVYRPAQQAVPYSNSNLNFQPLQRSVPVVQQTQQTEFQKYLNSRNVPQQVQYQQQYQPQYQQQYQQPQYQQSRQQISPLQRCEDNAQRQLAYAQADYQASTMYNNDGFFSGSTARVKFSRAKESAKKSYISCMQSAQRKVLRDQYQAQSGYSRY